MLNDDYDQLHESYKTQEDEKLQEIKEDYKKKLMLS